MSRSERYAPQVWNYPCNYRAADRSGRSSILTTRAVGHSLDAQIVFRLCHQRAMLPVQRMRLSRTGIAGLDRFRKSGLQHGVPLPAVRAGRRVAVRIDPQEYGPLRRAVDALPVAWDGADGQTSARAR